MKGLQIAVAAGKGGIGKTSVAAALALSLNGRLTETQFLDCDVEAPDAALFLKPTIEISTPVTIEVSGVDTEKCTGCGECQAACQYNAIRVESGKAEVFKAVCRGCGGCRLVCPVDAITGRAERIGVVESGSRENIIFHRGTLDIGRPSATPLIRGLKALARSDIPTVVDCGSGSSTQVVASIRGSDYCILVTEPTCFGLHDLKLAMRVVQEIGVPAGIVINKDQDRGSGIEEYASDAGIPILMRIPFTREIAAWGSRGVVLSEADGSWDEAFWAMYEEVARAIWKSQSR